MAPWIPPEKIAKVIYDHFKRNKPYVLEPWSVKLMPFSKAILPATWFDKIFKMLGLFNSFDQFKGRA
jgi:hypothetical protein